MKSNPNKPKHNQVNKSKNKQNYPANRNYNTPQKRNKTNFPQKNMNVQAITNGFFGGNLVDNMNFGGNHQEVSGYVKREFIVEDKYGNKQTAREKQFFNSGKKLGKVRVNDDESNF